MLGRMLRIGECDTPRVLLLTLKKNTRGVRKSDAVVSNNWSKRTAVGRANGKRFFFHLFLLVRVATLDRSLLAGRTPPTFPFGLVARRGVVAIVTLSFRRTLNVHDFRVIFAILALVLAVRRIRTVAAIVVGGGRGWRDGTWHSYRNPF